MPTAEKLFTEMKSRSETKPDLITFSTLIKGFCKERNIDSAFKVLNEMK
jgi:pentatricopeptide repeat protein